MTYIGLYPSGFWFMSSTGEIVEPIEAMQIWSDGHGRFTLRGELVTRVEPWEML